MEQKEFAGPWPFLKNIVGTPCYLLFAKGGGMAGCVELNVFPKQFDWGLTGKTNRVDGLSSWSVHF